MKEAIKSNLVGRTDQLYWFGLKLPLILYWFVSVKRVLGNYSSVPLPTGICNIIECGNIFKDNVSIVIVVFIVISIILYLLEKWMRWITLVIFFFSVLIFSAEESNGVLNRNGMYSFIFFAQSIAYWYYYFHKNSTRLNFTRTQYSIQIVGFSYFLSGASKILESGFEWASDGKRITLQVLKSFYYNWATTGNKEFINKGEHIVRYIESNGYALEFLLWCSLFLEIFAFTTALNLRFARYYGIMLLLMHIGISYTMDILIMSFVVPMTIILINPLGLLLNQTQKNLRFR